MTTKSLYGLYIFFVIEAIIMDMKVDDEKSYFDIIFHSDILLRRILITSFVWQWWRKLTMQGINKMVITITKFIHFIINKISQVLTMSPILTIWLLALQLTVYQVGQVNGHTQEMTDWQWRDTTKASKETKTFKIYNLKAYLWMFNKTYWHQ